MTSPAFDVSGFGRISLAELNERAALLDRSENKYALPLPVLSGLTEDLAERFDVLAIDGITSFTYETVYYDTPSLLSYHDHLQGKRRRCKVRSRCYVDSGMYFFEVKLKGLRGRTIKERIPYQAMYHGAVAPEAFGFLQSCVKRNYGEEFSHQLSAQLMIRYHRLTLVGKDSPERVTIDSDLLFRDGTGSIARAPGDTLIVEVKSGQGRGAADQLLRQAGVRPGPCSKYCIGLNLVRPGLRHNAFKPVLTRRFGVVV